MKILLINPPRSPENSILKFACDEARKFIHKKLIGPPLGLMTVAGAVKDFEVVLIDLKGEYDLNPAAPKLDIMIHNLMKEHNPDIVGVTFIASEFYFGIEIFKEAKKFNPGVLTIAGGLHTTLCPEDFNDPSVDVVCPGSSAGRFREIVIAKEQKQDLRNIKGIILNIDGKLESTGISIIEEFPATADFLFPDRSLLKRWISTYKTAESPIPSTYIYTSLGCPYKCTFCSIWPQYCGKFHQRDIESVIKELKSINDYEIIRFADANTIVNIEFIDKLFDRIDEEKIDKFFIMDIRADTAVNYPGLIKKLAKNGLKVVICGFESYRNSELEKYNKKMKADVISKAIDIFHDNGIKLRGNYVIPGDYTEDDFKSMSDYACSHKVVYAGYTILTPMPGTVFYNEIKDSIIDHDLSKYNFFNCVVKTAMPLESFYENVSKLWLIKKGNEIL
jgi:hopanoid C-3 methylase